MSTFNVLLPCIFAVFMLSHQVARSDTSICPVRASSSLKGYAAANVFDGNWTTRWDSERSDPQWVQFDFGQPRELIGLLIDWENAYAYSYAVMLSNDGTHWNTVFETEQGNGQRDEIDFPVHAARYLRIYCRHRATAFGYSIFEVDLKTPDAPWGEKQASGYFARPFISTGSNLWHQTFFIPAAWSNQHPYIQCAGITSPVSIKVNDHPPVVTSSPNQRIIFPLKNHLRYGTTNTFLIQNSPGTTNAPRVLVAGSGTIYRESMSLLKEQQPLNYYKLQAQLMPEGFFPYWLTGHQGYWTVVGAENDTKESLFAQDGTLEPYKSFSITPFVRMGDSFITREQVSLTQTLQDGYLPMPRVTWSHPNMQLTINTFAWGAPQASSSYISYTLSNTMPHSITGKLYLAIRPFEVNPPWQWGGLNRIDQLRYDEETQDLQVNEYRLHTYTPPASFAAVPNGHPGITERLSDNRLPSEQNIHDGSGTASGAFVYSFALSPNQSKTVKLAVLLHPESRFEKSFDAAQKACRTYWRKRLIIPSLGHAPPVVRRTLAANLAYILINRDGPSIQPGSRAYEAAWIRDAAGTTKALLRCGFTNEVRNFIQWYSRFIMDDGRVPAIVIHNQNNQVNPVKEYDSQGQFVTLLYNYYVFTEDRSILQQQYTNVIRALSFLEQLRQSECRPEYLTQDGEQRYYGILPKSVSHEGYYPEPGNHSYWDDCWALLGWTNGIRIASILGFTNDIPRMQNEYRQLTHATITSISNTMAHYHIDYLPGCAELGDFDPSSSAAALVFGPILPQIPGAVITNTFDRYWLNLCKRFEPGWTGSFSPYELRIVPAFLQLGWTARAHRLFDYFMSMQHPPGWHQWPEALYIPADTPGYIGDMPHTWISGEFINTAIDLYQ